MAAGEETDFTKSAVGFVRRNRWKLRELPPPSDGIWRSKDVFGDGERTPKTERAFVQKCHEMGLIERSEKDVYEYHADGSRNRVYTWRTDSNGWESLRDYDIVGEDASRRDKEYSGPQCPSCLYTGFTNTSGGLECNECGTVSPKEAWKDVDE